MNESSMRVTVYALLTYRGLIGARNKIIIFIIFNEKA